MARLRVETAPEITVFDESFVIKAAAGATASLAEFKNSSGTVIASIATDGTANLSSPALTGVPTAPTAAVATNTTQVATTAFVRAEVAALVNSAGSTLDTLGEIATALGNDANLSTTLTTSIGLKAPLASPTFTGTVSGVTATMVGLGSVNNTADTAKPVSTAQQTALDLKANLASPTFTGTPTLPTGTIAITQTAGDSNTKVATTAFVTDAVATGVASATVDNLDDISDVNLTSVANGDLLKYQTSTSTWINAGGYALLASPTFTGTPLSTTASAGTNTTQVATTAFVTTAVAAVAVDFASDQNVLAMQIFG